MSHTHSHEAVYHDLQERFDHHLTGAPKSPIFIQILRLLYSPQEAEIARQLPVLPTPIEKLARRMDMPVQQLEVHLDRLARRGVVFDLSQGERRFYALPPVVIGFFEYVFMRTRDDLPMADLARLFDHYMHDNSFFASAVFEGETQLGRTIIQEEALPEDPLSEILDWERATEIIRNAAAINVTRCSCRHKASLIDQACSRPQETCLTLGTGGSTLVRLGMAREISSSEALDILGEAKSHGLMQVCDNVQTKPAFLYNCCGCCCGMIQAIRRFDLRGAIMTSNWLMEVNVEKCTGCGKCVKACPVSSISLEISEVDGKRFGKAVLDEELCLGCGVCASVCSNGGVNLVPRSQRTYTPETVLERYLVMAIERGKLADLIFSAPENMTQRALHRVIKAIEQSSPVQAALALRPLRSAFLEGVVRVANKQ